MALSERDHVEQAMLTLASLVWEIRRAYPRMELGQLHVLLLVLGKPGLGMSDLIAPTELTKSAVSRNTSALSAVSYLPSDTGDRRRGLGLVALEEHPDDARAKNVRPTPKGRRLAERLTSLLDGGR